MNKPLLLLLCSLFCASTYFAQSFEPAPGITGTIAVANDSNCIVSWATGAIVKRGYLTIEDTNFSIAGTNKATFGTVNDALGYAEGTGTSVISLGDGGSITLTFDQLVINGPGYDFAVFENGFSDNYMEFAHVEVSSDGTHFVRFPSTTEVSLLSQQTNFTYSDCRMVNNLAGKYRTGFGTPFDLSDLPNDSLLNLQSITHIRLIDVVGSINPNYGTTDANGTIINDPFPTPFESGGFDLDGIGIINATLNTVENSPSLYTSFNSQMSELFIQNDQEVKCLIYDELGSLLITQRIAPGGGILQLDQLDQGIYFIRLTSGPFESYRHFIHP
jgi:hypothetical protein